MNKEELRKEAKTIRKSLDIKKSSDLICEQIRSLKEYENAKNIMLFYPLSEEVDLLNLLSSNNNFYLPRVKGFELEICPFKAGDELRLSRFKTLEPVSNKVNPELLDLIFTPALAVDKNFYRLGYGGGFYDRFLSKCTPKTIKIAPISESLILESLPVDNFDVRMDIIVSEKKVYRR